MGWWSAGRTQRCGQEICEYFLFAGYKMISDDGRRRWYDQCVVEGVCIVSQRRYVVLLQWLFDILYWWRNCTWNLCINSTTISIGDIKCQVTINKNILMSHIYMVCRFVSGVSTTEYIVVDVGSGHMKCSFTRVWLLALAFH